MTPNDRQPRTGRAPPTNGSSPVSCRTPPPRSRGSSTKPTVATPTTPGPGWHWSTATSTRSTGSRPKPKRATSTSPSSATWSMSWSTCLRHEALCRIPRRAGRDWRNVSGSNGLSGLEREKEKIACQLTSARAQAYGARRWGTRVIWRKLNCLKPNLQKVQVAHPPEKTPVTGASPCSRFQRCLPQPFGVGAMPSEGIQGDEWAAYVTLDTYGTDERGIAYGARALRRHSARSSRRSHDLPGRTGRPSTGRRGTGDRTPTRPGGMRNAKRRDGAGCPPRTRQQGSAV